MSFVVRLKVALIGLMSFCPAYGLEEVIVRVEQHTPAWQLSSTSSPKSVDLAGSNSVNTSLANVAGVSLAGQGGYLRSVNVRGLSGWRVQHRVEGVPIHGERRAGSSLSFVPSFFGSSIDLVKKGVALQNFSSALAGVVDVRLQEPQGLTLSSDLELQRGHYGVGLLVGRERLQGGIHLQNRERSLDGSGADLNDGYEAKSAFLRTGWLGTGELRWRTALLASHAQDIGKSNSDFRQLRDTSYPEESHVLGKLELNSGVWQHQLWWHANKLETLIRDAQSGGRLAETRDRNSNLGLSAHRRWESARVRGGSGLSLLYRPVIASRQIEHSSAGRVRSFRPFSGDSLETALYTNLDYQQSNWIWTGGIRIAQQRLSQGDRTVVSNLVNAHLGLGHWLTSEFIVSLHFSLGERPANLVETLSDNLTPRGRVLGDPALKNERLIQSELDLEYRGGRWSWQLQAYYMWADEFIQRQRLDAETLIYAATDRARLWGLEFETKWQLNPTTHLVLSWHNGRVGNRDGQVLAGTTPREIDIALHRSFVWGTFRFHWSHRQETMRIAIDQEQPLDANNLLGVDVERNWSEHWHTRLWLKNALDDAFVESLDDKATLGSGREIGFTITYRR
ncbi:MAG: TonB-dependent receptor [Pseudomonadota bacterium]